MGPSNPSSITSLKTIYSAMDASDARELKLQQTSASRLAEFETLLPRLLWKSKADEKGDSSGTVVRTLVRNRKAHELVLLVNATLCFLQFDLILIYW